MLPFLQRQSVILVDLVAIVEEAVLEKAVCSQNLDHEDGDVDEFTEEETEGVFVKIIVYVLLVIHQQLLLLNHSCTI